MVFIYSTQCFQNTLVLNVIKIGSIKDLHKKLVTRNLKTSRNLIYIQEKTKNKQIEVQIIQISI